MNGDGANDEDAGISSAAELVVVVVVDVVVVVVVSKRSSLPRLCFDGRKDDAETLSLRLRFCLCCSSK